MANELLLAGDIGATKTSLALFHHEPLPEGTALSSLSCLPAPLRQDNFVNADFADFDTLLAVFLQGAQPVRSCFGVAGPVREDQVRMTNLPWLLAVDNLQKQHNISKIQLINDLVATALGAIALPDEELHTLHSGHKEENAAVAVLAPGSGLGEAFLIPSPQGWWACPSEGSHAAFAPANEEQIELLRFMWQQGGDSLISVEQLCSGLALPSLFAFMARKKSVAKQLQAELAQTVDDKKNPLILHAALQALEKGEEEDAALATLRLMVDILAAEAAAFTLKTMARGGLFIGGGLGLRLLPFLDSERFMAIFSRGAHHQWLAQIPIRVITTPRCALLGAAISCARQVSCK